MFRIGKGKQKGRNTPDEKPARKSRGNDSGRKTWGFPCSPDIKARMKMLADRLHVHLYALTEHAVQLSAGLIARVADAPEECELLRAHILDDHVGRRTIEKLAQYDQDMADVLDDESHRRFQIDKAVRQIVVNFVRAGLTPQEIASGCLKSPPIGNLAQQNGV
jgi:hypothetical protein